MTRSFWLAILLILWGCDPPAVGNQTVEVTFDHTRLAIPKQYLLPPFPSSLIPSQGMDKDVGALLDIPLRDLGYDLEKKIGFRYELTFLVTPLSGHHLPLLPPPSGFEAWNGSGLYQDRFIEFDQEAQLYRVYSDSKYRDSWEFFKSYPDSSKSPEPEWVAGSCSGIGISPEKPGWSNKLFDATCDTVFLHKDIHIKMTLSGRYIKLIEELKRKVQELFSRWEQPKETEHPK